MSKRLKDYSKLGKRQQNRRVPNFVKYGMIMNNNEGSENNVTSKKSVTSVTNSMSPSIIRIVPSSKISIVRRNSVKTFFVKRSNNIKIENTPSTSDFETGIYI
jgi:hypothetical protein